MARDPPPYSAAEWAARSRYRLVRIPPFRRVTAEPSAWAPSGVSAAAPPVGELYLSAPDVCLCETGRRCRCTAVHGSAGRRRVRGGLYLADRRKQRNRRPAAIRQRGAPEGGRRS
jgi:hypothetical protein